MMESIALRLNLSQLLLLLAALYCICLVQISGFVPIRSTRVATVPVSQGILNERWRWRGFRPDFCLLATGGDKDKKQGGGKKDDGDDDEDQMFSGFFFDMSKTNVDSRSSMDVGIYELLGGGGTTSGAPEAIQRSIGIPNSNLRSETQRSSSQNKVVVMDWECLLDAIPYHIELGIHAARTIWPHLNDLCNFDTDRDWLENKLFAMSHVMGSPEGPDKSRHVSCEFALATRLILEEQALDRNESTGKNGKYARKFHPRSEINGNNEFEGESRSRRPLTAGELAVNWREFIRSTLIVKYSRGPDGKPAKQEPMEALEQAIEEYLMGPTEGKRNSNDQKNTPGVAKSLPLFPQTKFALRNSATKLVVRISHKFDNDIVARSLNQQLQLLPHERIAKTYKPENAIRRLFLNENKNIVLLLRPDSRYEIFHPNESDNNRSSDSILGISSSSSKNKNTKTTEENCLEKIMKFTHQCDNSQLKSRNEQLLKQRPAEESVRPTTPSVVWVDSSWHRLQGLAPVFGDTIPGGRNGNKNTARCSIVGNENDLGGPDQSKAEKQNSVWLSLWLAEWPSSTSGSSFETRKRISSSSSSENHEAAMVYPWTDSLSWDDAEDILIPTTWGSSDTAFQ
jgi:hypothetical protein